MPEHYEVKRLKMADRKIEADEENLVAYISMGTIES
jgi:hypothetical protein